MAKTMRMSTRDSAGVQPMEISEIQQAWEFQRFGMRGSFRDSRGVQPFGVCKTHHSVGVCMPHRRAPRTQISSRDQATSFCGLSWLESLDSVAAIGSLSQHKADTNFLARASFWQGRCRRHGGGRRFDRIRDRMSIFLLRCGSLRGKWCDSF